MLDLKHRFKLSLLLSLVLFIVLWNLAERAHLELRDPKIITGWSLLFLILFLACYNLRKKLAAFNLGWARNWLALHTAGGFLVIPVYLLHTDGVIIPSGIYEQLIVILFWLVSLTGIIGLAIINIYPRLLTDSGFEIVYENIPSEIFDIRQTVETEIILCTEENGQPTLSNHYNETMKWYFRRPRFYINNLFDGNKATGWIWSEGNSVRRYLNDKEVQHLNRVMELAERKAKIDKQFACQDIMRRWLVFHIPLSVGLIALSICHVFLIHVYSQ